MTSSEWSQVDAMTSIEPSNTGSDLFDGDILGDELIDIYNAAVVGGSGDDCMNEIPSLLAPTPDSNKRELSHPGSGVDDGLGAFRPSTSFNDLATLLPPSANGNDTANTKSPPLAPASSSASLQTKPEDHKKRAQNSTSDVPAKRRRGPSGTKSKSKAAAGGSTAKKAGTKNNTPNPLSGSTTPRIASSGGVKTQLAKAAPKIQIKASAVSAATAVVTPRIPPKSKEPAPIASAPSASTQSATPTEADFKSVAQAAVSNLIMNAGGSGKEVKPAGIPDKIDTSTEHIKALTGTNWVSVCSGGDGPGGGVGADKMNNRARRQNLTPDERARQNRDRNREHARNTRLRKKAYVEELKRTLTALVAQRDATELEKRHSAQRELEQREVRFRVIEEFLKLRGRNEVNFARWAAILEENFSLTLPVTEFREMVHSKSSHGDQDQVLNGVSEAMADSSLFSSFLRSLGKSDGKNPVSLTYQCDRKNFFMDNCTAVLDWRASTSGAVSKGGSSEITMKGNLKAKFSPASNKLIAVTMCFDTAMVLSQLNNICKASEISNEDVAAAQVAASEADAILDSLQMPHIESGAVPSNVNVVPPSGAASITDAEKEDSSDESNPGIDDTTKSSSPRRVLRARQD